MDCGILLLNKPLGMTSSKAVQTVRKFYGGMKGGHTGTLDPQATGLLPICLGRATKFAEYGTHGAKTYEAWMQLGWRSTTGDNEGRLVAIDPFNAEVSKELFKKRLASFVGKRRQIPPMHSAVRRNGVRLYQLARQGLSVERPPREIEIFEIEYLDKKESCFKFRVRCSKGTYIRVLVEEIGASIGCGAYLSSLQRTHVANCDLSCAVNFQDLAAADREKLKGFLQNADIFLDSLKSVTLSKEDGEKICNGQGITLPNWKKNAETVRVYGPLNYFLGIGTVSINGYFKPTKIVG